tara:strand:- start:378 stop:863 length:486 start_codon:yes stop_codon:yes gene_type:complete
MAGQAALNGKEKNSQMSFTHGAIISKGGKKVCEGYNHKRSYSKGKLQCSFHAEIDVINKWESIFIKGKEQRDFLYIRKKAKKFNIYVVRLRKSCSHFVESTPCNECSKTIKKYGFKNIYYSNADGSFEKVKVKYLTSIHNSYAQQTINNLISPKNRFNNTR